MPPHEPRYYLRIFMDERWYILMSLKYGKTQRRMQPTWIKESAVGDKQPYLYRTLVSARAGSDRYVPDAALLAEVKIWENENVRA